MPNCRTTERRPPESWAGSPRTSGPRPSTPPEPTRCTSIFPRAPRPIPGGTKPAIKPTIYAGSTAPSKLLHRDMPSHETRLRRHSLTYLRTHSYGRTLIYTTTGRKGSSDLTLFGSPSVRTLEYSRAAELPLQYTGNKLRPSLHAAVDSQSYGSI